MLGCEVSILRSNALKLLCSRAHNFNITRQIFVTINFRKIGESLIGNLRDIKFVIADRQKVVIHILEDGIGNNPIGGCSIAQSSTIVEILLQD